MRRTLGRRNGEIDGRAMARGLRGRARYGAEFFFTLVLVAGLDQSACAVRESHETKTRLIRFFGVHFTSSEFLHPTKIERIHRNGVALEFFGSPSRQFGCSVFSSSPSMAVLQPPYNNFLRHIHRLAGTNFGRQLKGSRITCANANLAPAPATFLYRIKKS